MFLLLGGGKMSLFPIIFCTIAVFSLYGEYVVRFPLPGGVFYLVTTGWIFDISLRENSINRSKRPLLSGSVVATLEAGQLRS